MKQILSTIFVIVIVSGALSFTEKKGYVYCASKIQNQNCAVITNKTEVNNGKPGCTYFKYAEWDGTQNNCLPERCPTQTTLYNEE